MNAEQYFYCQWLAANQELCSCTKRIEQLESELRQLTDLASELERPDDSPAVSASETEEKPKEAHSHDEEEERNEAENAKKVAEEEERKQVRVLSAEDGQKVLEKVPSVIKRHEKDHVVYEILPAYINDIPPSFSDALYKTPSYAMNVDYRKCDTTPTEGFGRLVKSEYEKVMKVPGVEFKIIDNMVVAEICISTLINDWLNTELLTKLDSTLSKRAPVNFTVTLICQAVSHQNFLLFFFVF